MIELQANRAILKGHPVMQTINPDLKVAIKRVGFTTLKSWPEGTRSWRVTLTFRNLSTTFDYFTGPALTETPTAIDVVSAFAQDVEAGRESFSDFCADFGYEEDSRKAHSTWVACCRAASKHDRIMGLEDMINGEED